MTLASLLCFELPSLGQTYSFLNQALSRYPLEVLDASWMGAGRCFCLVAGERADIQKATSDLSGWSGVQDFVHIERADQRVLDALFSLSSEKLRTSLLVIEMGSLPSLLDVAHRVLVGRSDIGLMDIRPYRSAPVPATAFLTGDLSGLASVEISLKAQKIEARVTLIENCSPRFAEYFNLGGAL